MTVSMRTQSVDKTRSLLLPFMGQAPATASRRAARAGVLKGALCVLGVTIVILLCLLCLDIRPPQAGPINQTPAPQGTVSVADQELRDKNNRLLGKIRTLPNGKLELRDASNRFKGTYDPKKNETRDHRNRLVGKGNLLPMLLK